MTVSGNIAPITDIDIRLYLRDSPDNNHLLDDYEFTPEELRSALNSCVDMFNGTPPMIVTYTIETWPPIYRHFLLMGAVSNLLAMIAHSKRRNHLQYQLPGGAANDQAGWAEYMQSSEVLLARFREWVRAVKIEKNLNQGWASI